MCWEISTSQADLQSTNQAVSPPVVTNEKQGRQPAAAPPICGSTDAGVWSVRTVNGPLALEIRAPAGQQRTTGALALCTVVGQFDRNRGRRSGLLRDSDDTFAVVDDHRSGCRSSLMTRAVRL